MASLLVFMRDFARSYEQQVVCAPMQSKIMKAPLNLFNLSNLAEGEGKVGLLDGCNKI